MSSNGQPSQSPMLRSVSSPSQLKKSQPTVAMMSPQQQSNSKQQYQATPTHAVLPVVHDPETLLEALDQRNQQLQHQMNQQQQPNNNNNNNFQLPPFDPISFLNEHYESEKILAIQLPTLRDSVTKRMEILNDRIAIALQKQSDHAPMIRRYIQDAKVSCQALEYRILQVRDKAASSESAVLTITAEMKRLDCAKRHLLRTITTLKRLHMFVQAAEQLRMISHIVDRQPAADGDDATITLLLQLQSYPNYKIAANLVSAINELQIYFESYTAKVEPLQIVTNKVQEYQENLRHILIYGFRVTAFGKKKAIDLITSNTKRIQPGSPQKKSNSNIESIQENDDDDTNEDGKKDSERGGGGQDVDNNNAPIMTLDTMLGGIMFVDALGIDSRKQFIHNFCTDLLGEYSQEFRPLSKKEKNAASAPTKKQEEKRVSSFKKVVEQAVEANEKVPPKKSKAGLDQIEQRFTWFLNGPLSTINMKFTTVFPPHWNFQSSLVRMFLELTRDHILALLDGPRKDPDASNATILLKAVQKTILFEKDVTTWLERDCKLVFVVVGDNDTATTDTSQNNNGDGNIIPAVKPMTGTASNAYQKYMGPYIRLEEQSMNELLVKAVEDRTVDTRGQRPVFISSTNLFVYMKGSITRCTALTKGYALFLLYRSFRTSLKNYSMILNSKLPPPAPQTSSASVGGITFGNILEQKNQSNNNNTTTVSYIIPIDEEVTVCHVISTCEYCVETMESLEEVIRDTIDTVYKEKIDMISDQEQFHDITAKSIRILISGLMNRLDNALKEMSHTIWSTWDTVSDESPYVFLIHEQIEPFVKKIKNLLPTSYYRSFCDKFMITFTMSYYDHLTRQKKISEPGTQQILLDLYNLKTLFLKLPVIEDNTSSTKKTTTVATGGSIAPAMYTKMVQKQFGRLETILKLVGTPLSLLIDNFKVQWPGGTSSDLTVIMSLKGMKRTEQAMMLEKLGFDPVQAMKGATAGVTSATIVSEHVQALQDQSQSVAYKVNSDLNNMRQKVDEFRKTFR